MLTELLALTGYVSFLNRNLIFSIQRNSRDIGKKIDGTTSNPSPVLDFNSHKNLDSTDYSPLTP